LTFIRNAALSLNRRRRLCERVVDEGWTWTKAAAAFEASDHADELEPAEHRLDVLWRWRWSARPPGW
jgi:hypothetical protein